MTYQFKLCSWNVLHIIHELNYSFDCSFILDKWLGKESERLKKISKNIIKHASCKTCVVCLQECPEELLQLLKNENIHNDYNIYSYKYDRMPILKNHLATNPYQNCGEHLVVLVSKDIIVDSTNIVKFDDPGKASLIVNIKIGEKNIYIANIHCPFGKHRNIAFDKLKTELQEKEYLIIGDLNSELYEITKMFDKTKFISSNITIPTRIAKIIKKTKKGEIIEIRESVLDHIIGTNNFKIGKIFVESNEDLSDHLLIYSIISL